MASKIRESPSTSLISLIHLSSIADFNWFSMSFRILLWKCHNWYCAKNISRLACPIFIKMTPPFSSVSNLVRSGTCEFTCLCLDHLKKSPRTLSKVVDLLSQGKGIKEAFIIALFFLIKNAPYSTTSTIFQPLLRNIMSCISHYLTQNHLFGCHVVRCETFEQIDFWYPVVWTWSGPQMLLQIRQHLPKMRKRPRLNITDCFHYFRNNLYLQTCGWNMDIKQWIQKSRVKKRFLERICSWLFVAKPIFTRDRKILHFWKLLDSGAMTIWFPETDSGADKGLIIDKENVLIINLHEKRLQTRVRCFPIRFRLPFHQAIQNAFQGESTNFSFFSFLPVERSLYNSFECEVCWFSWLWNVFG